MKKIQHVLEYILVRAWLGFIGLMPLKYAAFLTSNLFILVGKCLPVTNHAKKNIKRIFPEFCDAKIEEIIKEVWSNLGYIVAETPYLLSLPQDKFKKYVSLEGEEILRKVAGKRVIFYSAHLANWELSGKALAPFNINLNAVYRPPNNKLISNLINKIRHKYVIGNMLPKGKDGAKLIVKALKEEKAVYMLVDQRMDDGIKIPFLGYDAMTAPAIATLAKRYNCLIVPVQVIRKRNSHFKIIIHPILEHKNQEVEVIMRQINDSIEQWVKENPGQWFWLHRRWGKLLK